MPKVDEKSLRKAQAEHRRWEDSPEGVAYWLGDLPVPEPLEQMIIQTVHKLPATVREFVFFNCRFISTNDTAVTMRYSPQLSQPWLLTVGETLLNESHLAHKIAHAWLGHEWDPQYGELRIAQQDEEIACDLIRQWGFAGVGTEGD